MRKILAAPIAAIACLLASVSNAAPIRTDIVFVVDESGSMGNVQANLRNNIGAFASILSAGGVDATYALVGYGDANVVPRLITNFTNPTNFATAAQGLRVNGGTEPGYSAIAFALNGLDNQASTLNFRTNSLTNIILVTDEPSNGDFCTVSQPLCVNAASVTAAVADSLLKNRQALLNSVLSGTSTIASFGNLTTSNGGQVFNLSQLGSSNPQEVQQFVSTFATAKLQEIVDTCQNNPNLPGCNPGGNPTPVPAPGGLLLLVGGLAGLGAARRFAA
ncbi:vWA domain-containing protein [Sabulicella glaciei]|uniref:VWA domain-containing protein n=1 Tax=Sabulicella glaciei TaxID=2984948 RepID=A0ABT3NT82_9PROT|nr:vWA domain-containing protein [Roseococcus sp. MDT2-1-1]MCW8085088.1 VWA domain-containing protein [Roseococcus sp. MDT2-1-1]